MEAAREIREVVPQRRNPVVRTPRSGWPLTPFFTCWFGAAGDYLTNVYSHVPPGMGARLKNLRIGNRRSLYGRKNGPGPLPPQKVSVNAVEKSPLGVGLTVRGDDSPEAEASNDQSEN